MPSDSSPVLLSTWSFAVPANESAWPALEAGGSSLDAVEEVCRYVEEDPDVDSVGYGGLPDHLGRMTLDASIMTSPARSGAIAAMSHYLPAITVARAVMERTRHSLLAGSGAEEFAASQGFAARDLLSPAARERWEAKRAQRADEQRARTEEGGHDYDWPDPVEEVPPVEGQSPPKGPPPLEGHDTVGSLALDAAGVLAGGCTTSGLAFKRPGRVGDSPIIGHGLYVEPGVGAAVATGLGELAMGVCATFCALESLRGGGDARQAAAAPLLRIVEHFELHPQHQLAVLVLTPSGEWSAAALRPGYVTSIRTAERSETVVPDTVILPASSDSESTS